MKLNVMLLILFLNGGEIVFRCNNLEEFIRVFKRRNKRYKKNGTSVAFESLSDGTSVFMHFFSCIFLDLKKKKSSLSFSFAIM